MNEDGIKEDIGYQAVKSARIQAVKEYAELRYNMIVRAFKKSLKRSNQELKDDH